MISLLDILWGYILVPGHVGVRGNLTVDELARNGSASGFVGPEPTLGVSRKDLWNKIVHWLRNQHWRRLQNLGKILRQARESGMNRDLVGVPRSGFYPSTG
jgi:hypothetical protein